MKLREHILKILPEYYDAVVGGKKTFEIRKNDRDYQIGDWIKLLEYDGEKFTGNFVNVHISYITSYEQKDDYVVFSFEMSGFGTHNADTIQKLLSR